MPLPTSFSFFHIFISQFHHLNFDKDPFSTGRTQDTASSPYHKLVMEGISAVLKDFIGGGESSSGRRSKSRGDGGDDLQVNKP